MKTVAYSCPFVPAEWIVAHGLRPRRIQPCAVGRPKRPATAQIGFCPWAKAFVDDVSMSTDADAVVFTTTCDQMRRAPDTIAAAGKTPLFLFHVPTSWQTVAAQKFYMDELKRLGRFLVELGGHAPSDRDLAEVMNEFETGRSELRNARGRLSPRQFSEAIVNFHSRGEIAYEPNGSKPPSGAIPVALVGGPLLPRHFDLFDHIEKAGGNVVLDATTTGERTLPQPFNRRELSEDPFSTMANAYFGTIPDAFRRPNSQLYVYLKQKIAERDVRGIVFHHYIWCDTWHAEAQRMKEWAGVPFLILASGDEDSVNGHAVSRIQSFLEMLK